MRRMTPAGLALLLALAANPVFGAADETPYGKGMTDANKERLVLDDLEDVSDWYNGSPVETTIEASDRRVKKGRRSLRFANRVDHTKGEKNYPVGWPRTGRDLAAAGRTDWSGYDFFECWVYAETSRPSLPKNPLSVGFYQSGAKRSLHVPLAEVKKDAWVKIVIPVSRLPDPSDVRRVQFNISESDYRHGDRVDFFIDDLVLTRYIEPAIADLQLDRKLLYSQDGILRAQYQLVGDRDIETTRAELAIGCGDGPAVGDVSGPAARQGELAVPIDGPLRPGVYWARLGLRDAKGRLIDRKEGMLRVVPGPFEREE